MATGLKAIVISLLGLLPLEAVSHVAAAEIATPTGNTRSPMDTSDLIDEKNRIFRPFEARTTTEDAYLKFKQTNPGLDTTKLDKEFNLVIKDLLDHGFIVLNKNEIISKIPSYSGGGI